MLPWQSPPVVTPSDVKMSLQDKSSLPTSSLGSKCYYIWSRYHQAYPTRSSDRTVMTATKCTKLRQLWPSVRRSQPRHSEMSRLIFLQAFCLTFPLFEYRCLCAFLAHAFNSGRARLRSQGNVDDNRHLAQCQTNDKDACTLCTAMLRRADMETNLRCRRSVTPGDVDNACTKAKCAAVDATRC